MILSEHTASFKEHTPFANLPPKHHNSMIAEEVRGEESVRPGDGGAEWNAKRYLGGEIRAAAERSGMFVTVTLSTGNAITLSPGII